MTYTPKYVPGPTISNIARSSHAACCDLPSLLTIPISKSKCDELYFISVALQQHGSAICRQQLTHLQQPTPSSSPYSTTASKLLPPTHSTSVRQETNNGQCPPTIVLCHNSQGRRQNRVLSHVERTKRSSRRTQDVGQKKPHSGRGISLSGEEIHRGGREVFRLRLGSTVVRMRSSAKDESISMSSLRESRRHSLLFIFPYSIT